MNRKFLEELGIEKENIDKIMTENGNDINSAKQKAESERDALRKSLDETKAELKKFEGVDVADLQNKVATLTKDLEAKDAEYAAKLADREFEDVLSEAVKTAGGRSVKAIRSFLDVDKLKASKNRSDDIKSALEEVKKSDGYLFGGDEPIDSAVSETGIKDNAASPLSAMRAAMGLPAEK